eukprot:TRINITY_DN8981_c0_g1_i1.p1 TRINITY_DN8981_c0_g1~~TRINITY_DN8981_c0_g1_i1.p1  ORF type:complete len:454 (-),score=82.97 TRINITY_DN8981_c0_g1_i1:294-1655(-)
MAILLQTALLFTICATHALDNGVARTPPMGWSSWLSFKFNVSADALTSSAQQMADTGFVKAGYNYLLLDDGWPACLQYNPEGFCTAPHPRDPDTGRIVVDKHKFPHGLKPVIDQIHALGMKFGIYSAPHDVTCGGFSGSLGHEATDAQMWAELGVDFVKMDAGCQDDCSIHNGCQITSLTKMRDALNSTGRSVLYYVDAGNPTSGPKVFNPHHRAVQNTSYTRSHTADRWTQEVLEWGPDMANMWKLWFDRWDGWQSLKDNAFSQIHAAWFQSCGAYNNPDMMTIGLGGMSEAEYRSEVFLYTVLGAPFILTAQIAKLQTSFVRDLLLHPEILAINQDSDCVQGSRVSSMGSQPTGSDRWAGDVWIRPLADSTFAVVLLNNDPNSPRTLSLRIGYVNGDPDATDCDFFPAGPFKTVSIRDVHRRKELGVFNSTYEVSVAPHDSVLLKVTPVDA